MEHPWGMTPAILHGRIGRTFEEAAESYVRMGGSSRYMQAAAAYCGLSTETFEKVCPLKPIRMTDSARGERYLRQRIDEWLLSIDPNGGDRTAKLSLADRLYKSESGDAEPAFVPLAIAAEPSEAENVLAPPLPGAVSSVLTLEIGPDVVMRIPGDVPVERVAALVRAMRGAV